MPYPRAVRYWLCVRGRVSGPFSPEELAANPDFRAAALVCPLCHTGTLTLVAILRPHRKVPP